MKALSPLGVTWPLPASQRGPSKGPVHRQVKFPTRSTHEAPFRQGLEPHSSRSVGSGGRSWAASQPLTTAPHLARSSPPFPAPPHPSLSHPLFASSPPPSPSQNAGYSPVSQVLPVKPTGHSHTAEPLTTWHWPPFTHPLVSHGDCATSAGGGSHWSPGCSAPGACRVVGGPDQGTPHPPAAESC